MSVVNQEDGNVRIIDEIISKMEPQLLKIKEDLIIEIKKVKDEKEEKLNKYKYLDEIISKTKNSNFLNLLNKFCKGIRINEREIFWRKGQKKFVENPEKIAQGLVRNFLQGWLGPIVFVGEEIMAGEGFIAY